MAELFFIVILIMSVVIHEVSHGFAAYVLGDPTAKLAGRLTLNPLPHLDPLGSVIIPIILIILPSPFLFGWAKPVPFNPYNLKGGRWGPAYVALAGPASNIVIALFFSIVIRMAGPAGFASPALLQLSGIVVLLNLVLAMFNLIPVPPLDGSKLLFAALPYHLRHIEYSLHRYQFLFIILALFLAINLLFPLLVLVFSILTGLDPAVLFMA